MLLLARSCESCSQRPAHLIALLLRPTTRKSRALPLLSPTARILMENIPLYPRLYMLVCDLDVWLRSHGVLLAPFIVLTTFF